MDVDTTSVEGPHQETINLEDEETEDLASATPLKKYVKFIDTKKGNACKWTCNFGCKKEPYTGSYSRIRAHLIGIKPGQKAAGVALCSKVNKEERQSMQKEEAEAEKAFGGKKASALAIPRIPPLGSSSTSKETQAISNMFKISNRNEVDSVVARLFYTNGIPFNVARSPFWYDMIRAVNEAPKGYKPPSDEKIRTNLLDKEKSSVEKSLMPIKEQWSMHGVTIVSDGWTNIKNQSLINVMSVSGGRAIFLTSIDCSGDEKTGVFVYELLMKVINEVGLYNAVQVLTDNAANCKRAGAIIEETHPHISWSGCMAHTLSLLMKDIAHSKNEELEFVNSTYRLAKTIVKYIKNHSMVLYMYRNYSGLDVMQVKKTRFGSHYVMLERVIRVKNQLLAMVLSDGWENIKKGRSNVEHDHVKKIILDEDFWAKAKLILSFTKPIWFMIRFCDSDKAFIGEVYQRMASMSESVKKALVNHHEIGAAIGNLITSRWEMMNRPLHCLAYVLTPFYYSRAWLKGGQRKKPIADEYVARVYLDVVEKIVRDKDEALKIRKQLSDFLSNRGNFARPQSIEDRETLSAMAWWGMYGETNPELHALAVKVLSQSVNSSCSERAWSTYSYIHSVKRNKMNANQGESLVYVHYNHRVLSRYRADYEAIYKNWDVNPMYDSMDVDEESVENREYKFLFDLNFPPALEDESVFPNHSQGSSRNVEEEISQDKASGKRPRLG